MMRRGRDSSQGTIVRKFRLTVALGLMLGGLAAALGVATPGARAAEDEDTAYLVGGVGAYDVIQNDESAMDFRIEYRHGGGLWIFKPWLGLEGTSDGALYGLGGILADVQLGRHIVLTPSLGVGAYSEGDGKDLGHTLEFRSQVELAYRFDNSTRIGVAFSHISNASLGDTNPGVEVINLYYALPIGSLLPN